MDLRVLTYNVHGQKDDRDALAAVVKDVAPDVLIVQEGPRRFRWQSKTAALARSFDMLVAAGGLPALGNVVLTNLRVRVHDAWSIRLPHTAGRHMRGAAFAECSVGPVRFVVAGSHLSTHADERPAQAEALRAELSKVDHPVLLGADFNESSSGEAWRILQEGMTDAAAAAGGAERPTFSCANPRERIDALFVDPRVTVLGYDVVDTPEALRASDHFPVVAHLDLT
ncbi:endonuclease/exonuclease/phosphatase family protein [Phytohabitans flavus]|uniref:Metal-dependent hydrolase n=1 Tax=Phytohabitans flavus TaxID=1076124 RepID=A0A6F8XYH5_9ACTN|nr:endonuclease/exonuclease/phosphatase family protein [Phytohabitans flavus]BCB78896.1 metal-dependent hydrolase [Phytohabitans flavus]